MKIFTGKLTKKSLAKTSTVSVGRVVQHPLYGKRLKRTKNYLVHDETEAKVGDMVRFVACKPYSKSKKWKIIEIVGEKKIVKKADKKVSVKPKKATKSKKKVVKTKNK